MACYDCVNFTLHHGILHTYVYSPENKSYNLPSVSFLLSTTHLSFFLSSFLPFFLLSFLLSHFHNYQRRKVIWFLQSSQPHSDHNVFFLVIPFSVLTFYPFSSQTHRPHFYLNSYVHETASSKFWIAQLPNFRNTHYHWTFQKPITNNPSLYYKFFPPGSFQLWSWRQQFPRKCWYIYLPP